MQQQGKKIIWYFAFGKEEKSSLLNEFTRQHNLSYIREVKQQKDLEQYKNKSCIIQSDVKTLLHWEPLFPNIETIFIGDSFKEDQQQIKKEYQQIGKCRHYPSFKHYQQFRKLIYPNLIFFYGPNQQHSEGAAATIAFQAGYKYVKTLPQSANSIISSFNLTENYTFSHLFTNTNQIQVLQSRFNLKIIHFKHNRNDFPNLEQYFNQQNQLLNYLHQKPYFTSINAHQSPQKMMDQIGQILCPQLVYISANNPQQKIYAQKYSNQSNTVALSIFYIQSINKRKNLSLACTLKQKILLVNSIIYKDLTLKQIVLIDFPYHVNQFRLFQNLNRKFTKFVELDSSSEWMYCREYCSGMYFLETQRYLRPDLGYQLKEQIKESKKYWIITGAQGVGKTTVSKYMAERYGLKLIQVQPYLLQLKEKLLTPQDGEELPIQKIFNHFQQLFQTSQNQQIILDSFPFDPKKWFQLIGPPHVINLKIDPNELIKRQRKKNQSDLTAQITEEQLQKAQQSITQSQNLAQKLTQTSPQTVSYTIDYNCTIIQSQKLLSSVYQPRLFLVQSMPTLLYHNIALRYGCGFYNLSINSLQEIKNLVKQGNQRNVIIYNYQQVEGKMVSEDLYWIQKNIGKIRYLAIWNGQNKTLNEEYLQLQKPVVQKPQKNKQQGEEDAQQQPVQEQEQGEVKKKPLDIYAYQWTKPVCHKNLTQWYFKLKKSVQEFGGNEKQIYKGFSDKLKRITEDGSVNMYEVVRGNESK